MRSFASATARSTWLLYASPSWALLIMTQRSARCVNSTTALWPILAVRPIQASSASPAGRPVFKTRLGRSLRASTSASVTAAASQDSEASVTRCSGAWSK